MTDFSTLNLIVPAIDLTKVDIEKLLGIDVGNLEETMQHQATLHCTFGVLAREAERQVASLAYKIDLAESNAQTDIRTQNTAKKRVVKAEVAAACNSDPNYVSLQQQMIQLKHVAAVLCTIEESFKERFGMVQQIAKRRSNELSQLN